MLLTRVKPSFLFMDVAAVPTSKLDNHENALGPGTRKFKPFQHHTWRYMAMNIYMHDRLFSQPGYFFPFFFFRDEADAVFSTLTAPAPPISSMVSSLTTPPCVDSAAFFLPFLPFGL